MCGLGLVLGLGLGLEEDGDGKLTCVGMPAFSP